MKKAHLARNLKFCWFLSRTSCMKCFSSNTLLCQAASNSQNDQGGSHLRKVNAVKETIAKAPFDRKPAPFVDLSSASKISVKHIRKESADSALIRQCLAKQPNKEGFMEAIDIYIGKNRTRRGHIDFISTAMKFMEPYKFDEDVEIYNKLIDVFPKDKFVNRSLFDAIWPKAHPQMFLALDILTKMEWKGVLPNDETHDILHKIFGSSSLPLQKVYRMWFWFEEFKDINPYKLPDLVYKDRINIVKAAIDRILGNNDGTRVVEVSTPIEENDVTDYKYFIISSQTSVQRKYIEMCDANRALYIEGPIHIWMNHTMENYFILKTGKRDLVSTDDMKVDEDEEREGVILAVCFVTKPYEETLQRWIEHLQSHNETLKQFQIIFNINDESTAGDVQVIASS